MSYTLNQAAKATGKSKSTINGAIKRGRITAIKGDDGSWMIDPAELHRVYPPVSAEQNDRTHKSEHANIENIMRIRELETKLDASFQHRRLLENQVDDLREERDRWRTQATTLLQSPQRSTAGVLMRGWQWLFGKRVTTNR